MKIFKCDLKVFVGHLSCIRETSNAFMILIAMYVGNLTIGRSRRRSAEEGFTMPDCRDM
jgi:hypothetical protein